MDVVSLFWTMNWAKSPTTLEEGVTWKDGREGGREGSLS